MDFVHGRLTALVALVAASVFAAACGGHDDASASAAHGAGTVAATEVTWNSAQVDVGSVQALVEHDQTLVVFGTKGMLSFVSGALVGANAEAGTAWRSAAVIPSPDGRTTWVVAVDQDGHVQRVRDEDALEDVTDRYGLGDQKVQLAAGGDVRAGFLLESGAAITDGTHVTRYDARIAGLAAAGKRVALVDGQAVRIYDDAGEHAFALPGATQVAFDGDGNVLAATEHELHRVSDGVDLVFSDPAREIRALASAGTNVWIAFGSELGLVRGGTVAIVGGVSVASDARIVGSPSGDVWVIAGGAARRFSAQAPEAPGEAEWNEKVEPINARVCSNCHGPPGLGKDSSRVDLSTFAGWSARRDAILQRVVKGAGTPSAMPPPTSGFSLSDAERAAIADWATH